MFGSFSDDVGLFCGYIGLFCGDTPRVQIKGASAYFGKRVALALGCHAQYENIGLLRMCGLLNKDVGLFCGYTGLFCGYVGHFCGGTC